MDNAHTFSEDDLRTAAEANAELAAFAWTRASDDADDGMHAVQQSREHDGLGRWRWRQEWEWEWGEDMRMGVRQEGRTL